MLVRLPRSTLAAGTVLLVLLGGCGSVDSQTRELFQQAQQTFDQAEKAGNPEEFLKAAALYQKILDRGVVSGAVLYNQGNALMRAGERGRAIAAYRRAKRYLPRDPHLEANLANALGTDSATAGRRRPLLEYVLVWQNWISYPAKFYLAAFSVAAAFALGVLAVGGPRRRLFGRLAVAAGVISLVLIFSAGYDWYRFDYCVHGVIVQDDVVARKGNAQSYAPAFTQPLDEGTEFRVVERRADWLWIRLDGGAEGWIEDDAAVVY